MSLLAHLDKNKLALFNTRQNELYDFMVEVAGHMLGASRGRKRSRKTKRRSADAEVEGIIRWLRPRAAPVVRGEKLIPYSELRKILTGFGYYLENPKNNSIDVVRYEKQKKGVVRRKSVWVAKRIGNIPYPGERKEVAMRHIKFVREICGLREEDGVDSDSFYHYTVVIYTFVNRYRKVLRNLART